MYPAVLEDLLPAARHRTDRYANNRVECDHGRLKARLHPMRDLNQDRSAREVIAGHAFVQNLRRGHYELAVTEPTNRRVAVAFDELVFSADLIQRRLAFTLPWVDATASAGAATARTRSSLSAIAWESRQPLQHPMVERHRQP